MEDFTLPSVGTRFKKWECYTSILPKCQAHPQNFVITPKIKFKFKLKIGKNGGYRGSNPQLLDYGLRSPTSPIRVPLTKSPFFLLPTFFAHVVNSCWLAPAHAALSKILIKFLFLHNF
jgi:hypothetical protein